MLIFDRSGVVLLYESERCYAQAETLSVKFCTTKRMFEMLQFFTLVIESYVHER